MTKAQHATVAYCLAACREGRAVREFEYIDVLVTHLDHVAYSFKANGKWFWDYSNGRDDDGFKPSPLARRRAPVAAGGMMSPSFSMWPIVDPNAWCGEHQPLTRKE